MPKLKVNGKETEFVQGMTVLQACESAGVEIPRFCYHERLQIAGNCRMCLVDVAGGPPKPVASCAMPAAEGMDIHTDTPKVKKAREGVMEFLLINHPLDCPICDQGGECDLQDQAMVYGKGKSRFPEEKRAVKDKYMGPLIKTHMTRCIHCTRCIRFLDDVAGVHELGAVHRGEHMEVSTYVEKSLTSELSGNIIDLCPVGALTSRPYAFKARPWELRKTESIDVLDGVGSAIRIDSRGREVMRILPRLHEDVNEEWISDKARFSYDGLRVQRLDTPYVRRHGKLVPASWEEAFDTIAKKIQSVSSGEIAAIAGDLVDCEAMFALQQLLKKLKVVHMDCRQDGNCFDYNDRSSYLFNTTIADVEKADVIMLIGTHPRFDAPLVNTRIRKAFLQNRAYIGVLGQPDNFSYSVEMLGDHPVILQDISAGHHPFVKRLKKAHYPLLILGQQALAREDGKDILMAAKYLAQTYGMVRPDWNGFNVLHRNAAQVGGLDIGFVPGKHGKSTSDILSSCQSGTVKLLYLLGADEIDMEQLGKTFVIYQGHHGDRGAHRADVILPSAAYTEKEGTYVNTEGRVQMTQRAVFPPGLAQEDWGIIQQLSEVIGHNLFFTSLSELREQLYSLYPHLSRINTIMPAQWQEVQGNIDIHSEKPFSYFSASYYLTNAISRASRTMHQCHTENIRHFSHSDHQEVA